MASYVRAIVLSEAAIIIGSITALQCFYFGVGAHTAVGAVSTCVIAALFVRDMRSAVSRRVSETEWAHLVICVSAMEAIWTWIVFTATAGERSATSLRVALASLSIGRLVLGIGMAAATEYFAPPGQELEIDDTDDQPSMCGVLTEVKTAVCCR